MPFQSTQAEEFAPLSQDDSNGAMTGTMPMMGDMTGMMPMMGDMMSMTSGMMDMMQNMQSMPMTGSMPGMTNASSCALSLYLMGDMLEIMGIMHDLTAPCTTQGWRCHDRQYADDGGYGRYGQHDAIMPTTDGMPMMGDMANMTGTACR